MALSLTINALSAADALSVTALSAAGAPSVTALSAADAPSVTALSATSPPIRASSAADAPLISKLPPDFDLSALYNDEPPILDLPEALLRIHSFSKAGLQPPLTKVGSWVSKSSVTGSQHAPLDAFDLLAGRNADEKSVEKSIVWKKLVRAEDEITRLQAQIRKLAEEFAYYRQCLSEQLHDSKRLESKLQNQEMMIKELLERQKQ